MVYYSTIYMHCLHERMYDYTYQILIGQQDNDFGVPGVHVEVDHFFNAAFILDVGSKDFDGAGCCGVGDQIENFDYFLGGSYDGHVPMVNVVDGEKNQVI